MGYNQAWKHAEKTRASHTLAGKVFYGDKKQDSLGMYK
jgi:hypothetical protein